jgi:hypothetical protein
VTPQNVAKFWAVATLSIGVANGLGLTAEAAAEIGTIERLFELVADDPAIYPIWKGLSLPTKGLSLPTKCLAPRSMMLVWWLRCWYTASPAS